MNPVRIGLALAATTVTLVGSLAHAGPSSRPQVTDPAGDALLAGFDIVAAQLSTTGLNRVFKDGGRTVRAYKPTNLVATVTLSEPPSTLPGTTIQFYADTTACANGFFQFRYTPGAVTEAAGDNGDLQVFGCGDGGPESYFYARDVQAVVKGNTITWSMAISTLGPELRIGTLFRNFRVYADVHEPVFNIFGTQQLGMNFGTGDIDFASSNATWRLR